jgi:uncharacterized membrane protein
MAVNDLKRAGFEMKDVSVMVKEEEEGEDLAERTGASVAKGTVSGAAAGGVIGGLGGLLAGVGAIAVPGLGAILIGGPIAAALGLTGAAATTVSGAVTGALAGGLTGGLVGLGIPEERARDYEEKIRAGGVLILVSSPPEREMEARRILEHHGAANVESVSMTGREKEEERTMRGEESMSGEEGETVNPVQVQKFLEGVDYPVSKEELIKKADQEGADKNVRLTLERLPDRVYNKPTDVSRAVGQLT